MQPTARPSSWKMPILARCLASGLLLAVINDLQADSLDADSAVRLAYDQAEVRGVEQAGIDIAASALTAASIWPNPELRLSQERGRGALAGSDETSVLLSQTWDVSGSRGLSRRAAELGVRAAEADAVAARIAIRSEVLQHFHLAVAADERATAAAEQRSVIEQLASLAARRTQAGDLSGFEAQRIANHARRAQLRHEELAATLLASRERLAAWVGPRARTATLRPAAVLVPAGMHSSDDPANAELMALQRHVDAAEAAERAAVRWRMPVSVGIGQKRVEAPGGHDQALLLEAAIPLPLFERNQAAAQQSRAQAELARARLAVAARQLEGRRAGVLLVARQLSNSAGVYRDEVVPQARRLSEIASSSFADGEIDLAGLLGTLASEAEAIEQSIDLHYRARLALVELESLSSGESP